MEKKVVLVTGVGGNVGQGILRNIISTGYNVDLIGCNTVEFSAGNHFCKKTYQVPIAFHDDYISVINQIVSENKINLIIPSTDYEVFYLSKYSDKLNCNIAVSGVNAAEIYLDKYKSFLHHKENNIPFVSTVLPSQYTGEYKELIAKPREGRGSRGLVYNPADLSIFSDQEYIIQELHRGKEITSAFYVTRQGELHGQITLERTLDNGVTMSCKVVHEFDENINRILDKIIENSDIIGSANLQSIVNENGEIFPFEINCRISGTNSIRSNFGFKDVQYTLQEHLYNQKPDKSIITDGHAVRILMDIIYKDSNESTSYIF